MTRRTTTVRFCDVLWEEVQSHLVSGISSEFWSDGPPCRINEALARAGQCRDYHGAIDPIEGTVWRVERRGEFDFLVKYVRPEKKDGCYLPEASGLPAVWNWRPQAERLPAAAFTAARQENAQHRDS